jgi:hypothetical protein
MEAIMTRITQLIVGFSVVGVIAIGSAVAQSLVEHYGVVQQETRPEAPPSEIDLWLKDHQRLRSYLLEGSARPAAVR